MLTGAGSFGCGLIALGWINSREFGLLASIAGLVLLGLLAVTLWTALAASPAISW